MSVGVHIVTIVVPGVAAAVVAFWRNAVTTVLCCYALHHRTMETFKPTCLLGLAGQPSGLFTEDLIKLMTTNCEMLKQRPIIMVRSLPTHIHCTARVTLSTSTCLRAVWTLRWALSTCCSP